MNSTSAWSTVRLICQTSQSKKRSQILKNSILNHLICEILKKLVSCFTISNKLHCQFCCGSHVDRTIDKISSVLNNIESTLSILEAARHYWTTNGTPEKFVHLQVSTDEVYGSLDDLDPPSPNTPTNQILHIPLAKLLRTTLRGLENYIWIANNHNLLFQQLWAISTP